jgi:hypothetical protein
MPDQPDQYWVARMNATGRAQARYLWVLFLAALFYAALYESLRESGASFNSLRVPIVDLDLDARVVLASGPATIAFVVLVMMGALRATKVALERIGPDWEAAGEMERFDEHPNALELACYTTSESNSIVAAVLYILYPLLLIAALAEALWLWVRLQQLIDGTFAWSTLRVLGILLFLPALWLAGVMTVTRVRKALKGEHMKPKHTKGAAGAG